MSFTVKLSVCLCVSFLFATALASGIHNKACEGTRLVFNKNDATLYSYNFDGVTLDKEQRECDYRIEAPAGKRIRLHFEFIDLLESQWSCTDKLNVYNYDGQSKKLIKTVCGKSQADIVSSGNQLLLEYEQPFNFYGRRGYKIKILFESSTPTGSGSGSSTGSSKPVKVTYCANDGYFLCTNGKCLADSNVCNDVNDCGDNSDEQDCDKTAYQHKHTPSQKLGLPAFCGQPSTKPSTSKIVGGAKATPNSWPWQAMLRLNQGWFGSELICGGTLIAPQWVITAQHCFGASNYKSDYQVYLGRHYRDHNEINEQQFDLEKVILYPNYNQQQITGPNDLALIKLSKPAKLTDQVSPACLTRSAQVIPHDFPCYVSGWGETKNTGHSHLLKQAAIPVISNSVCHGYHFPTTLHTSQMCAGVTHKVESPCSGDSGGPLACYFNNQWTVAGAVSWGETSCTRGIPTVFTRLASFSDWIVSTIKNN